MGTLTDWASVSGSLSTHHVLALKTDGTLWAWGDNTHGELGDGTVISRSSPVQIGVLTTWLSVLTPRGDFSIAVKSAS